MAIHIHFEIVGIIALGVAVLGLFFTYYRTYKSDKEKIEILRHELLIKSNNYLQEVLFVNTQTESLLSNEPNKLKVIKYLPDIINIMTDHYNNTTSIIKGIKIVNSNISDRNKYPDMEDLRKEEISMGTFEARWKVIKPVLEELNETYEDVLDMPLVSQ